MKKKSAAHRLATLFIVAAATLLILFPLYWMLSTSLKPEAEIFQLPPTLLPETFVLENYEFAWTQAQIPIYFLNSVTYVLGTLVVVLICGSLAAYGMSRFKFRGKPAFLLILLLTQVMPMTTLIVPLFVSFGNFGLLNNRIALIAVYSAIQLPLAIWLLLAYFNSVPKEIDEAARIDGCTGLQVLLRIILPLAKPGLMAVGLSISIWVWQELMLAMTFTTTDAMRPLMAGISASIGRAGVRWGQMNAVGMISIVPIIIAYIFLQRNLVAGLTGGAVKE
ncbi:MAG: carbohydrate ABC transporter permease [Oscillospiraceae bacterium]|nr:carbohydrate ABC transporter permease [Oscillospiraceae bacterium]